MVKLKQFREKMFTTLISEKSMAKDWLSNEDEEAWDNLKLKPEFVKKMKKSEKQKGIPFKSIEELRKMIKK